MKKNFNKLISMINRHSHRESGYDKRSYLDVEKSKHDTDNQRKIVSVYEERISALETENTKCRENIEQLNLTIEAKDSTIDNLNTVIEDVEANVQKQKELLKVEKELNVKLRSENFNLQEENELVIGRGANAISALLKFTSMLQSSGFSSLEECAAAVKSEIAQSINDMGFEVVDVFDGKFNSDIHRVVDTKKTEDNNLNDSVAEVIRPGIWYKDRCLIPMDE